MDTVTVYIDCLITLVQHLIHEWQFHWRIIITSTRGYVFVNFAQKLPNRFAWIFREGWQWASEQMIKFWWWSISPSGYRDCFLDSSLYGDTENGINRLRCAAQRSSARHALAGITVVTMTSLHHWPLVEVCIVPVLPVLSAKMYTAIAAFTYFITEIPSASWGWLCPLTSSRGIAPGAHWGRRPKALL